MSYTSYVCQAAGTSIIGGGAPWITERHYILLYMGVVQARSGRQRVENDVSSGSGSVVVTAYDFEPGRLGSNPEWG